MHSKMIAVFPGSFDPLTNGHIDIVERALTIFDTVIVAVVSQTRKSALFTVDERVAMISEYFASNLGRVDRERVRVESFSGLLVEYVRKAGARAIVRGLRAISDFDYEAQMALINRRLSEGIETFFLMAREENSYISSSLVRQVAMLGGDVSRLVPQSICTHLSTKFAQGSRLD